MIRRARVVEVDDRRALLTSAIDVNRTTKVTKGGDLAAARRWWWWASGDGVIGFGAGKASEVGAAIDKAYRKASVSLVYVKRFEEHTIFHEVKGKYCKTICKMLRRQRGGIVANDTVEAMAVRSLGIKNIKAKVHGSHHPHNTVRAVFAVVCQVVESPEVSGWSTIGVDGVPRRLLIRACALWYASFKCSQFVGKTKITFM